MCAKYMLPPGEKGAFPVLPEGTPFRAQIQAAKLAYARGSGEPTIECYLTVVEGIHSGEKVYHQYSLSPQALWRVRDDLRTLGRLSRDKFPTDKPIELEDVEMVKMLDGAIGWCCFFTDIYKGSPRSKLTTEGFLTPEELEKRGFAPSAPSISVSPSSLPEAAEPF